MKIPIVPFDVAKDLKELGFDWQVSWMYYYMKFSNEIGLQFCDFLSRGINPKYGFNFNHRYSTDTNELPISAPEQALIVKWFRDVHKIVLNIIYTASIEKYEVSVVISDTWCYNRCIPIFNTYEEAELEGIRETIKYLKNERNS